MNDHKGASNSQRYQQSSSRGLVRGDVCHEMNVYLVVEFDSLSALVYLAITILSFAFQASLQLSRWHTETLTNSNDIQSQLYA
ncbi:MULTISPECIES: hypothetical protein [unclassified Pseudoalteromonas]|uniref:hypothetical protein n=1 Tax=unclassified Pseudoalteromonas TaxID=194690 RepID=UPI003014CABA